MCVCGRNSYDHLPTFIVIPSGASPPVEKGVRMWIASLEDRFAWRKVLVIGRNASFLRDLATIIAKRSVSKCFWRVWGRRRGDEAQGRTRGRVELVGASLHTRSESSLICFIHTREEGRDTERLVRRKDRKKIDCN